MGSVTADKRVPVDWLLIAIVGVIVLALLFDFTNGFHDAANSVATVVATPGDAGQVGAVVLGVLRRRHGRGEHGGQGGQARR